MRKLNPFFLWRKKETFNNSIKQGYRENRWTQYTNINKKYENTYRSIARKSAIQYWIFPLDLAVVIAKNDCNQFRATRDEYIFQSKKILGKKLLFKQIQKFAIYIVVMFALWKPLVIFYLVEFLFALFLCLLEFLKEIWLFTVHYPLETQLQEGMLITMHTKTTDIYLVNLARAMKDA